MLVLIRVAEVWERPGTIAEREMEGMREKWREWEGKRDDDVDEFSLLYFLPFFHINAFSPFPFGPICFSSFFSPHASSVRSSVWDFRVAFPQHKERERQNGGWRENRETEWREEVEKEIGGCQRKRTEWAREEEVERDLTVKHLTVKHGFLMSALVLYIPSLLLHSSPLHSSPFLVFFSSPLLRSLRSLHHTETQSDERDGWRRDGKEEMGRRRSRGGDGEQRLVKRLE